MLFLARLSKGHDPPLVGADEPRDDLPLDWEEMADAVPFEAGRHVPAEALHLLHLHLLGLEVDLGEWHNVKLSVC